MSRAFIKEDAQAKILAGAIFVFLVIIRNPGVLGYLLNSRHVFTAYSLKSMLRYDLIPALSAALLAVAAWGGGRKIFRWFMGQAIASQDAMAEIFALGLGMGMIAYNLFLLGLAHRLAPSGLLSFVILWALLAILPMPALKASRIHARNAAPKRKTLFQGLCLGLLAFAGWHVLILALAPPTEWDVLAYHLAIPKLYLSKGGIFEIPWMIHSHWPHLMEILYCLPLAIRMDNMAALIHALLCVAWLWAVFVSAKKFLDTPTAWIAATLLATQPLVLRLAGTAHSDGAWAFFHFLSAVAVWSWSRSGGLRWLLLGGLLSGLAASCKLLGLIPFTALGIWISLHRPHARGPIAWKPAALFWVCGFAIVGPWYAKTYWGAGNPIWPFLPGLFGGRWGGPAIVSAFINSNYWSWLPSPGIFFHYGPAFLLLPTILASGAAFSKRAPWPEFLKFLWYPVPFYLPFVARHNELWRFLLPFLPAMALTVAWFSSRRGYLWLALLALSSGVAPVLAITQNNQLFSVLALRSLREPGKDPRSLYQERSLEFYGFCEKVNGLLAGGPDKVLLFREIRGYPLDVPYQWGDPVNQGLILYSQIKNTDELRRQLASLGITYVLVDEALVMYQPGHGYYDSHTLALMEELLRLDGRRVLNGNGLALYRLL